MYKGLRWHQWHKVNDKFFVNCWFVSNSEYRNAEAQRGTKDRRNCDFIRLFPLCQGGQEAETHNVLIVLSSK